MNNWISTVALSKAILSHETCISHSVSILSGTYTISISCDKLVKNVFCNRIVNAMDWVYSNSVAFCIEQLHQVVTPIVGVCNCSMFCCTLLYVHFSFAIILIGKRELVALLSLSSWCFVMVVWLFLAVPCVLSAVCDCSIS